MSIDTKLFVSEIQRFCMHDGPGVRTTVFLKGCPLRCEWCHNPETQNSHGELLFYKKKCIECRLCESLCSYEAHSFEGEHIIKRDRCTACGKCASECPTCAVELCGKEYTVGELLLMIEKDRAFYGEMGGVTLSGGEPLMQGKNAIDLLEACKSRNISTVVETCGFLNTDTLLSAIPFVDLFLWDIKDTDAERHKRYTGVSNQKILDNLYKADKLGARVRLRCILVNRINTETEHYKRLAEIASSLSGCEGIELIPYHSYGGTKAVFIGKDDNGRTEWIPSEDQLSEAKLILKDLGINVI